MVEVEALLTLHFSVKQNSIFSRDLDLVAEGL